MSLIRYLKVLVSSFNPCFIRKLKSAREKGIPQKRAGYNVKTIEVKHLMVPLYEYTTVNENATLHEAVLACSLNYSVLIDGDRSNE